LITITNEKSGANAVLSGLFFDPVASTQSVTTASLVLPITATLGHPLQPYDNSATDEIGTVDFGGNNNQAAMPASTATARVPGNHECRRII
jgi:hypothetical protein